MPVEIQVALIGLAGSALGAFIGVVASAKVTQFRLEKLEQKVDKHNSIIERTYILEGQMREVQHEIRDLKEAS